MTFKRTSRIVLVGLAVAAFAGGVTAQQAPGIFERDDEGQIWQTLPSFGQPAGDCEWADVTGDTGLGHDVFDPDDLYPDHLESLRWLGAPLQCPGGAPIGVDQLFDPRGVAVFDPGPTAGFENSPETDTARLSAYRVYAADTLNHRIVSWDYFGEDARTFGGGINAIAADGTLTIAPSDPIAEGQLLFPEGVAVDASGNVLVADQYGGRLSVFTAAEDFWFVKNLPPNGAVRGHRAMPSQIAVVPGVTIQEPAASCTVPGAPAVAVTTWTPWFDASHPATDGDGMSQVLVYDAQFCLVEALGNPANLIDPSWGVDAEWPSPRGSFWMPNQVAFDDSGRLFVADSANYKIEIFDAQLEPLLMICNPDPANGPHADCAEGQPGVIATTELTGSYGIVIDRRPVVDPVTRAAMPDWQRLVIANHRDQEISVFEVNLEAAEPEAEFAFRLRSEGGLAGFPRAVAQDQVGRYFVVVPGLDKVQMFDIPALAVFDQTWAPADSGGSTTSVRPNEDFYVTYSIVVPPLKATVLDVEPTLSWTGPAQPVDANSLPISVPIAEAVTGPLPEADLQQGQVLTYKFRFKALDSSAADMVFTIGAEGNPVNGVNATAAATKTVTVPIVCQSCEQNPPVVTADPLGTEYSYNSEPIYGDGRINLIASDPSPGGGSAESSGISRITYRFIGPEEARQPGTHTVVFTPNEANPTAPVDIDGETKVGGGSALISLTESGRHTIVFQAWDGYGNPSGEQQLAFWLDLEPPTVTFEAPAHVGTDPNDRRWWKTDVTLTAVKTDTQTPTSVTMVEASTPPAGASVLASSATFTAEGMDQRVQVTLTDLVGNTATVFSPVVAIDKTAPQTTASPASGTYVGPLTVTLGGADPMSGVRNVRYQLSGAACDAPDAPAACSSQVVVSGSSTTLVLTAGGSTTVTFFGTDWATNAETVRTATYVLNRPPVGASDTLTVAEDTPGSVLVLGNDSDPDDGDTLELVAIVQAPQHGRAEISGNTILYTPAADYTGADSLTYRVRDSGGLTAIGTVTITVTGAVDPPNASHDFVTTPEETPIDVAVLLNDANPDGDALSVVSFTQGRGTVTQNPDGTLRYTPATNFFGEDTFTYDIRNGSNLTDGATVFVTVTPVDDPPNAVDDSAATDEETAATIAVTANDTHPDGDDFTLTGITAPPAAHGTAAIQGGAILFTPAANFFGTATFSYTITDADGDTDTATVTVTVRPIDDLPTAVNDSATTAEDTAVTIDVLDNDGSPDGTATIVATTPPPTAAGSISVSDNTITFTPAANYSGTASFTYTLADPDDDRATATVTVTVTPVNDPPVAVDDTATTPEDTPLDIDVRANDSDPDDDSLSVTAVTQPASGGAVTINTNGTVRLEPAANFSGTVTFTYTISDGTESRTATVTVTVTSVNDAPTAVNDSYTVVEGQTLVVPAPGVLTNDTDVDDAVLTAARVTSPSRGTLMLLADGGFTYESTLGYTGPVTFTYDAIDGDGLAATATVTITVLSQNAPPICSAATASPSTLWPPNHRRTDEIEIEGITDPDGDGDDLDVVVKYIWQDEPTDTLGDGAFAIDGWGVGDDEARVRRERQGGQNGRVYEIGFEATDENGGSCTGRVFVGVPHDQGNGGAVDSVCRWDSTVANGPLLNACNGGPTNQPPSVSATNQTTVAGTEVQLQIAASDPDEQALTFSATGLPPGLAIAGSTGIISGTPAASGVGTHSVTVTVNDTMGASGSASFTWTITAPNQVPTGASDSYEATAGDTLEVPAPGVLDNDSDGDDDDLTAVLVSGPANGTLTLNPDGSFSYVAATGFSGSVTFTYRARDENEGESEPVTVTITVAAPLTAVDDQYVASAGTVLNVQTPGVLGNDEVPEGQGQVTVAIVSNPGNGSVVLQTNGAFAYTPPANFGGTTTFTYRITRGSQTSNTATVSIRVNRAPTATADTYTVEGNTTLTVSGEGVLDNDSDPDGGMLTAELAQPASSGTVSLNPDGSFTYTPANGFVGTATFAYRAVDEDEAESASTTVTITVTAGAPTAVADAYETRINTALTTPAPGVLS
ncbi:MAG: Ig-like domain-containing protein, partial [Vicinamibacterales bacterium]